MLKDLEQRGSRPVEIKTNSTTLLNAPSQRNSKRITYLLFSLLAIIAAVYFYFTVNQKPASMNESDSGKMMPTVAINDMPVTPAPEVNLDTPIAPTPPADSMPDAATSTSASAGNTALDSKAASASKATPVAEVKSPEQFETKLKHDLSALNSNASSAVQESAEASAKYTKGPTTKTDHSAVKSGQATTVRKEISPEQKSVAYHQQALLKLQQGRVTEAQADLAQALEFNPVNHEARLTYASLLLDNKRHAEARDLLAKGLMISPEQNDFRIALARLQVDAGDPAALNTLEEGQSHANNNADYQSFYATMLQRANRHDDAINHYKSALALTENAPNSTTANTLIGLGISLQATEQLEDAKQAFTRVKQNHTLSPELAQFVEQRLKQINQRLQR